MNRRGCLLRAKSAQHPQSPGKDPDLIRKTMAMANATTPDTSHYYVPHGSPWPIRGSVALFAIMLGAVSFFNDWANGWAFLPGAILLAYMFFGWFATVIGES